MAMANEFLEAVHGNNNDITLTVDSPKPFIFQFYSPPVLLPPPPLQQESPQESVFHSS
jgi:hypothetical protein